MGEGKYYSQGLDLPVLATMSVMEITQFSHDVQKLLLRILTFPLVTVAAINGHVYAAGVFIALAHDCKVIRSDHGWWCLNEIHIKRNFPVALIGMTKSLLPQQEVRRSVVLGQRYTGEEAKAAGIVDEVCPLAELRDTAITAAVRLAGQGLDRRTLSTLKYDLHREIVQALTEPPRMYSLL
jgi:enoyl-CoA hydratase/carnithine racemase